MTNKNASIHDLLSTPLTHYTEHHKGRELRNQYLENILSFLSSIFIKTHKKGIKTESKDGKKRIWICYAENFILKCNWHK